MTDSGTLKMIGLSWLRYTKQMTYLATEAGNWRADVLGADKNRSIEIEVKVSAYDLDKELDRKQTKHWWYAGNSFKHHWTPNRFFFLVPEKLRERALKIVETKQPKYGVLVAVEDNLHGGFGEVPWKRVVVARSAKPLHLEKPSPEFLQDIAHRMASELCGFHMMRQTYGSAFDRVRELIQSSSGAQADLTAGEVA